MLLVVWPRRGAEKPPPDILVPTSGSWPVVPPTAVTKDLLKGSDVVSVLNPHLYTTPDREKCHTYRLQGKWA